MKAIDRGQFTKNIFVYRCIAKQENKYMQSLGENEEYYCKDFKGVHVENKIKQYKKTGPSGYIFILIPKNSSVAYINDIIPYRRCEKELLINKEQRYKLLKKFECKELGKQGYLVKLMQKIKVGYKCQL